MTWEILVAIILNALVVVIQTLALSLLVTSKQKSLKGSQKLLLIALSVTELTYALVDIVTQICHSLNLNSGTIALLIFNSTTVTFMYIFIMTCIVIDRFLEIYLNIKYSVLWSTQKTKNVLLVGLVLCFFHFIPFYIVGMKYPYHATDIIYLYMYPVFELIFVIIATFSYYYITNQVLKCRRYLKKLEEHLSRNNRIIYHKQSKNRFKLFVPILIIVTFLLFMVGSNILRLCVVLKRLNQDVGYKVSLVLIPVGLIADPIIYIFSLKAVRLAVTRTFYCRRLFSTESIFNC